MNTSGHKPAARVLLVDDEKSIRASLREFLVADGYTVEAPADAQEALRLLGDYGFDVVVSDIVLPQINGIELLQAIRTAAPLAQVILMTRDPTVDKHTQSRRRAAEHTESFLREVRTSGKERGTGLETYSARAT